MLSLYWNPTRISFTIPWVHCPVTWYGILFACGLVLGHRLFSTIFRYYLHLYPQFNLGDLIGEGLSFDHLTPSAKKNLSQCAQIQPLYRDWLEGRSSTEKKTLLYLLNQWLEELPAGVAGLTSTFLSHRLARFFTPFFTPSMEQRVRNRLQLEAAFPSNLRTLREKRLRFTDILSLYLTLGAIAGARIGHLIFYESPLTYLKHPLQIFKIWEGGLASHGGVLGGLIALSLFLHHMRREGYYLSLPRVCDLLVLPSLILSILIRMGNFINQEILGKSTILPWGITFGNPVDHLSLWSQHPVQLYEAAWYLFTFCLFFFLFSRWFFPIGRLSGFFFLSLFSFRWVIEYLKQEQSALLSHHLITMGQLLSIPCILFGLVLLYWGKRETHYEKTRGNLPDPKLKQSPSPQER